MLNYRFPMPPKAVLFDLDGTLVDSAPDLAAAVNHLRARQGLADLPLAQLRPFASHGARGLIGAGLGVKPEQAEFAALRDAFLNHYEAHATDLTCVFDGVERVLSRLEQLGVPWGIVTNKHARFTRPVVDALGLAQRAAVVVSGDTTPHAKPHPAPMLYAAHQLGLSPTHLIYVGDDSRDIEAARAAGYMSAFAAAYGYCAQDEVADWRADAVLQTPDDLLAYF
ncbi:MAG: phosphoglycolate phosphatase [Formosimonas sp.]